MPLLFMMYSIFWVLILFVTSYFYSAQTLVSPIYFFLVPFSLVLYDRVFSIQNGINANLLSVYYGNSFFTFYIYIFSIQVIFVWFFTTCYICATLYYGTVLILTSLLICVIIPTWQLTRYYAYIPILVGRMLQDRVFVASKDRPINVRYNH